MEYFSQSQNLDNFSQSQNNLPTVIVKEYQEAPILATVRIENNISHSEVEIHFLYIRSLKRFLIYFRLCLETAGNVLLIVFY